MEISLDLAIFGACLATNFCVRDWRHKLVELEIFRDIFSGIAAFSDLLYILPKNSYFLYNYSLKPDFFFTNFYGLVFLVLNMTKLDVDCIA